MAYNEKLADRIRERMAALPEVEEKPMMGGLAFMYHDKMCVGIMKGELMCRIAPERQEEALEKPGSRIMDFTGKPMNGYILVDELGQKDFEYWIGLCLEFNPRAKAAKRKKK